MPLRDLQAWRLCAGHRGGHEHQAGGQIHMETFIIWFSSDLRIRSGLAQQECPKGWCGGSIRGVKLTVTRGGTLLILEKLFV